MVWVGRALQRPSGPTSCDEQGRPQLHQCSEPHPLSVGVCRDGQQHLSGQPVQCLAALSTKTLLLICSLNPSSFHPSDPFCGPSLDALQQLHVPPVLSTPHLDAVLQVRCPSTEQSCRPPPSPCWPHCSGCPQGAVGSLCCEGAVLPPPAPPGPFQQG